MRTNIIGNHREWRRPSSLRHASRGAQPLRGYTFWTMWLIAGPALAAVVSVDDWFGARPYPRLIILAAAAFAFVAVIQRSQRSSESAEPPGPSTCAASTTYSPGAFFASEPGLAIEHIQSILVLLHVSASHNQPVPRAVLVNLELVLKSLSKLHGSSAPSELEWGPAPDILRPASSLSSQGALCGLCVPFERHLQRAFPPLPALR